MKTVKLPFGQKILLAVAVPIMMTVAFALAALGLILLRRKAKEQNANLGRRMRSASGDYFVIENDKVDPNLKIRPTKLIRSA